MSDQYRHDVAEHYAAYRPPLHRTILSRALIAVEGFDSGLDIGCGTGKSSVALADSCQSVIAIDPSPEMLNSAQPHDRIAYRLGSAESVPVPDQSTDVVSFAGSLPYADISSTAAELHRVGRPNALVVVYDFEVLIDRVLRRFGVATSAQASHYNHRSNLSGVSGLTELIVQEDRISLDVLPIDLAHVLLTDAARHADFARKYGCACPLRELSDDLRVLGEPVAIQANIFYSTYRLGCRG